MTILRVSVFNNANNLVVEVHDNSTCICRYLFDVCLDELVVSAFRASIIEEVKAQFSDSCVVGETLQ